VVCVKLIGRCLLIAYSFEECFIFAAVYNYFVALSLKGCQRSNFQQQKIDITLQLMGASPPHSPASAPALHWGTTVPQAP